MEMTYQYNDLTERELIINSNSTNYLVAEKNISEGNFLVFSTEQPIGVRLTLQEQRITELTEQDTQIYELLIERGLI